MGSGISVFALNMKFKHFTQRLVPRSLSTRLILLTLGTLLVVQAATLATVAHFRQKFTEEVTVEVTATTIRTLRASLAQVPEHERAELVKHASRGEWQLWSRTLPSNTRNIERKRKNQEESGQQRRSPPDDLRRELRHFVTALNNRLDDGTRVGLSRGELPRLYISLDNRFDNPDKRTREWLVIPLDRLSPPLSSQTILAWLGGVGCHAVGPNGNKSFGAAFQCHAGCTERIGNGQTHASCRIAPRFERALVSHVAACRNDRRRGS